MKIVLVSMPDVVPLVVHESAIHIPNLGIASVGANIDQEHMVYIIDLVRKRRTIRKYLTETLSRICPDIVGLSAMAWQYDTCIKIIRLIKDIMPHVKIAIGGYHATLMYEDISCGPEAEFIDFMIRGEGEEAFRQLVNALDGKCRLEDIPSLSYKNDNCFIHNPRGNLLDLTTLKLPIRDARRLTSGYHMMNFKMEALETSRGCTRSCTFCSIGHMYGKSFRMFPIDRVLADLDDIYYNRNTRMAFVVDDNFVLNPKRVIALCDAIIKRKYKKLKLVVQADCISVAQNEEMVKKMAHAGFKTIYLGIENVSEKNLDLANKGHIVESTKKAVSLCNKYGIMVIGGLVFGFPDDDESSIIQNYRFLKDLCTDAAICQILTPYPKTKIREYLFSQGLITNPHNYRHYNGMWANVRTRHLDADRLQYLFWYHRQNILGWWNPSPHVRQQGRLWTSIWILLFKPILKLIMNWILKRYGWEGRYRKEMERYERMNRYRDL